MEEGGERRRELRPMSKNPCAARAVDRTGEPVERSDIDHFGFSVRNMYSAQNQFLVITQAERMVDRTGKPVEGITGIAEERESSSAQIRTLFDEQRQMIIAECCEKISHHELQAARAEQERQILQEELWRQQKDFREVHQQSLTEMEELRKFQSSTFDTIARRRLIEDQNTIWNYHLGGNDYSFDALQAYCFGIK